MVTGRNTIWSSAYEPAPTSPCDEVRVARLQIGRRQDVAGEDQVAEAGRERLDPRLHALDVRVALALPVGVVRPMRVRPRRVLAGGRGAREGSATDCWPRSMNGRSARPPATGASAASVSSSPPPTCTVPASRASGAFHGIGPSSAQSTFRVDGP